MSMDSCEIGQKRIRDRKAGALCIFDGCKKRESFTVQCTLEAIRVNILTFPLCAANYSNQN